MAHGIDEEGVDKGGMRRSFAIASALLVGLAVRVWWIFHYPQVTGDTLVYGDIARNLMRHGVYGLSEVVNGVARVRPTLIRLPGYPLFLAACFSVFGVGSYRAVMVVQAVFDLGTCLLLGSVAGRMFGGRARVAAVWLGALCPFVANYVAAPLTETLTLFCTAMAFFSLVRWREVATRTGSLLNGWVYGLGAALAYSILLRPEQGLLAAAVVPAVGWIAWEVTRGREVGRWRAAQTALVVALLTVAPLLPWALRNWNTFHVVQPLAPRFANDPGETNPAGFQRWYKTWAMEFASTVGVYWMYDSGPIDASTLPNRAFDTAEQREKTLALLSEYNEETSATAAFDARFEELAEERIQAAPLRYYAMLPLLRLANMALRPRMEMLPVDTEWWKVREHPRQSALAILFGGINLGYFALAGVALVRLRRWGPVVWVMVGTIVLRSALLMTLDNSEPRYTLEFFPVLIVLGAGAVSGWRGIDFSSEN